MKWDESNVVGTPGKWTQIYTNMNQNGKGPPTKKQETSALQSSTDLDKKICAYIKKKQIHNRGFVMSYWHIVSICAVVNVMADT